ncbi:MAG: signal peptidase I [Candidatus Hecatellales archaeon]|nr:MAG: signal peptidase I [Candidatus Hecatellales archaeon]
MNLDTEPEKTEKSKGEKGLKGWTIAILTLLILSGVYAGCWLSLAYIYKTRTPITVVNGQSMLPTLHHGDIVILKSVSVDELIRDFKEGKKDIIVYRSNSGRPIIHRIHSLKYDKNGNFLGFIVQGDNNPLPDPEIVTPQKIIGKVVGILVPRLGVIYIFISSPIGYTLILTVIIFLIVWVVLDELKSLVKPPKNRVKAFRLKSPNPKH